MYIKLLLTLLMNLHYALVRASKLNERVLKLILVLKMATGTMLLAKWCKQYTIKVIQGMESLQGCSVPVMHTLR